MAPLPAAPREVVIVGGGTAGWMCAAALARFLENGWRVTLVESDEIGTVGVGEATIPQLQLFLRGLGIAEDEFLRDTQGTFKLGIEFRDWLRPGSRYLHSFWTSGPSLGLLPFHQYWLRAAAETWAEPIERYSVMAAAAAADRFTRAAPDPRTRAPSLAYAFHIDASLLARSLRAYAQARGVRRIEGRVARAALRESDGHVSHLDMEDGRRVDGELYLDCSGFRALVIGEALGVGYEDWSHWLPCDRALAAPTARLAGPLHPYTRASARSAGWQWRIPLQHRTGNGYVYASACISDDAAHEELIANLESEPLAEPRVLRFRTGKRHAFWEKNCVAVGLASGFMEPLESTSIHLVQSAVARFLEFLPAARISPADVAAYNQRTHFEYDRIRDFLILHYKATERGHDPFWRARRDMAVPDGLAERMRLFAANGRVLRDNDELFTEASWQQVMLGQGVTPAGRHPLADQLEAADLKLFLQSVRAGVESAVANMPSHADYVTALTSAAPNNPSAKAHRH